MSSTNKNGYELRTDLLGMAIGLLDGRTERKFHNEHFKPEGEREAIDSFTTEDVLEEAEKLYQFVQDKG